MQGDIGGPQGRFETGQNSKIKEEEIPIGNIRVYFVTKGLILILVFGFCQALFQTDLNEICRYASGTFNEAETGYSTNEKELLAIVRGI